MIAYASGEYWGDDIKYALECQNKIACMDWTNAKSVMVLHRGKHNEYLKYLKGRVKGLARKALPFGIYHIQNVVPKIVVFTTCNHTSPV